MKSMLEYRKRISLALFSSLDFSCQSSYERTGSPFFCYAGFVPHTFLPNPPLFPPCSEHDLDLSLFRRNRVIVIGKSPLSLLLWPLSCMRYPT
ncbi:hypothetical protein CTA2_9581 [Colletotrichum tanaceti]|nr:hypothetical protein CTA2_9581 [Colletotrichum tanaceti]